VFNGLTKVGQNEVVAFINYRKGELDCLMFMIIERNPFAFGPEGCESTIMGGA
jgi:hypothetical protein